MDDIEKKVIEGIVEKIPVEKIYEDIASPMVSETGKTLRTIPRAINAILAPFEKWMLHKEYSVLETKKLLELKLQNLDISELKTPDAYIAVPTLQAIEYCYDSQILRDMYASLLANAMDRNNYMKVHPAYVEVIKQLTPDEVKILNALPDVGLKEPIVDIEVMKSEKKGLFVYASNISSFGEECGCDVPSNIPTYIGNLIRLGLVEIPPIGTLSDQWRYKKIYDSKLYKSLLNTINLEADITEIRNHPKCFGITDFGKEFRDVCSK